MKRKLFESRLVRALVAPAALSAGSAIAAGEIVLIDFGSNESFRGLSVNGPDSNGNTWNSVWSGAFYSNLLNTAGQASSINFGFSSASGTDSFNGPAGPTDSATLLTDVLNTDIDAAALGLLGGALEAAFDYYVSSTFQIQGLDAGKTYDLTFFGSHKFSSDDATVYSIYADGSFGSVITSAGLDVQQPGSPWLHNRVSTVTIGGLTADANGIIYVGFAGANGGLGYLNAMQITAVPAPAALALFAFGGAAASRRVRR